MCRMQEDDYEHEDYLPESLGEVATLSQFVA